MKYLYIILDSKRSDECDEFVLYVGVYNTKLDRIIFELLILNIVTIKIVHDK